MPVPAEVCRCHLKLPPARDFMHCRPACAACCIAPSISSPIPGMPNGKPAGVPCVQLDAELRCRLFGMPERPAVCSSLQPSADMCRESAAEAMVWLLELDAATTPSVQQAVRERL